ncbi:MAG: hypothetical protein MJA30_05595 [Cytophagales bacterium]|nr:hypothetical protein [Cytophagales bacterium]
MKSQKIYKTLVSILFIVAVFTAGCDSYDDEGSNANELRDQTERLTSSWNGDRILFDGVDVTLQDFENFTLEFREDGTWTAEDGAPAFGSQGTWEFAEGNTSRILMNGVPVDLFFTTGASQLTLRFVLQGSAIGRTKGTTGDYVIDLSPLP